MRKVMNYKNMSTTGYLLILPDEATIPFTDLRKVWRKIGAKESEYHSLRRKLKKDGYAKLNGYYIKPVEVYKEVILKVKS